MKTKTIAYIAIFVALIVVGSYLKIPFGEVPITLQLLFIFLASLFLGRYAFLAVFVYLLLGFIGIPVFASTRVGPAAFLGPTGGYLIGFFFASVYIGFSREYLKKENKENLSSILFLTASSLVIVYFFGVIWLMFSLKVDLLKALSLGFFPFIIVDLIKAFVSSLSYDYLKDRIKL